MSTPSPAEARSIPAPVRLEGVSLRYDTGNTLFESLDFELSPGSFSFLTGPSGSGKSSLLGLIGLSYPPGAGRVHIFGQDTQALPSKQRQILRRRIGIVSQDIALIDHLTVFENAALPLRVTGAKQQAYDDDVKEILHWVGLGKQLSALPRALSGGEKQRIAIARAVIARPDLLIADEPTGSVDPQMGERLLRLFLEMNRMGTTVIIASHDRHLLEGIQADTYRLERGTLTRTRTA